MKSYLAKILVLALVLTLGVMFAVVGGQKPSAAQGEIGPAGLADDPSGNNDIHYMFTGVFNKEAAPEFATVVHCTNIGASNAAVTVQFFDRDSGIPATASNTIAPSNTRSFSTQPISTFNVTSANASVDIKHGSGWVLAPANAELICTIQIVGLDGSELPSSMAGLNIFKP
jgi:hypothetical protein